MLDENHITLLSPENSQNEKLVNEIAALVNQVYRIAENGIWIEGADRTSASEVANLIKAQQIAVARLGSRLVGCVRIQKLDDHTGEFGMLAALADSRGRGVGRDLVAFAEAHSRSIGLRTMQLELLVPKTWTLESKVFLKDWYTRIGYKKVRSGRIEEIYPQLAPLLATDCDFFVFQKGL